MCLEIRAIDPFVHFIQCQLSHGRVVKTYVWLCTCIDREILREGLIGRLICVLSDAKRR